VRRVLAGIVLPLVLVPCVAMEIADQEEETCETPICIVLATPETLNSRTHTVTIVESGCRPGPCNRPPLPPPWEEDTITATVTTVVSGSLNEKEFRAHVLHGSVQIDQAPDSYLLIIRGPFKIGGIAHYSALEAYPVKDGKVCTFLSLKDYASGKARGDHVIRPLVERKNCYSVDDLKRLAL
jgi:hypothetical protein